MKNQNGDEFDLFDLNPHRLDEEWITQPKLYFQYALKLADVRANYERAKADRDLIQAELE